MLGAIVPLLSLGRCDGQPDIFGLARATMVLPSEAGPGRVAIAPSLWGALVGAYSRKVHLFRVNVRVKFLDI